MIKLYDGGVYLVNGTDIGGRWPGRGCGSDTENRKRARKGGSGERDDCLLHSEVP